MPLLPADPAARFRLVAIAEALSWAGLLAGMFVKYVVIEHEIGVQVFGPVHGIVFMVYVAVTLVTWGALRWSTGTGLLAVVASVPPFGSWVFERWAARTGRLRPAAA
jgi:integral membrane protein